MPPTEDDKRTIGRALGRVPSGVFILTARHEDRQIAMMASWIQQISFDPPAIAVAMGRERPAHALLRESKRFAISILADGDSSLMKRYARAAGQDDNAFTDVNIAASPGNQPILTDALAWLECEPLQVIDFQADHVLFIAKVVAGELLKEGQSFTHIRGNGFHY